MKYAQPRGLNHRRVRQILSKESSISDRIDLFSSLFLHCPYKSNPLIGSADRAEVFTVSLDSFDCVTFIETVLALALSSDVNDFCGWLRRIRYDRGRVEWAHRNHYMTDWIRNNLREGVLRRVSMPSVAEISRERVLNVLPGFPVRRVRVKCVPKQALTRAAKYMHSGDLIFVASTRKNLDVFHAGIIARGEPGVRMRHASRSRGGVVEQELAEFVKANRMAGFIVMRPQKIARRAASRGSISCKLFALKKRDANKRDAR